MRAQGKDYIEIGVVQLSAVGGPKYLARDHEMWWDKKNKKLTAFKKHTFVFAKFHRIVCHPARCFVRDYLGTKGLFLIEQGNSSL